MLAAAGAALIEDDGPRSMQAAVVLGGDQDCARLMKAASLAQAGYVPFVVVSGPEAFGAHECDLTINYAERKGFPAVLFRPYPNDFTSTESEVQGIGKYLRAHGITRVLLVTSNYHTRRAARLFRRKNRELEVRVIPAADRYFTPQTWWQSREGRKTFLLEWTKTVASWVGA
ncbi:MAG: hypothetical protein JWP08_185 [Bryobacterales bacterium]|nr:hypothetical protein [Bryobacterales bacterium]